MQQEFPGRDVSAFLAFCAILVTLVLEGTTLGTLTRRLEVSELGPAVNPTVAPEVMAARREATQAAIEVVEETLQDPEHEHREVADELLGEERDGLDADTLASLVACSKIRLLSPARDLSCSKQANDAGDVRPSS